MSLGLCLRCLAVTRTEAVSGTQLSWVVKLLLAPGTYRSSSRLLRPSLSPNTAITPLSHWDYLGIKSQLCPLKWLQITAVHFWHSCNLHCIEFHLVTIRIYAFYTDCFHYYLISLLLNIAKWFWELYCKGIQSCSRDLCLVGHTQGAELPLQSPQWSYLHFFALVHYCKRKKDRFLAELSEFLTSQRSSLLPENSESAQLELVIKKGAHSQWRVLTSWM